MLMNKKPFDKTSKVVIEQGDLSHIPMIAALFMECFAESVLHHCGGRLPSPKAMEDVFTLVHLNEPEATIVARNIHGQYVGYCFAPTRLSSLWLRALWEGHILKWTWRWATGQYGFGLHPVKVIAMNKLAFLRSAIEPSRKANARILSIAVSPKGQGQGIGNQLLAAAMDYFHEKKVPRVRLEVRPDNSAALRLYEKWGFILEGYTVDSQGKWLIMFKEMEHGNV